MTNEKMTITVGSCTLTVEPTEANLNALNELSCLLIFVQDELEGDINFHEYTLNKTRKVRRHIFNQLENVGYFEE